MPHLVRPPVALGFKHDGVDDYIKIIDAPEFDHRYSFTYEVLVRIHAWGSWLRIIERNWHNPGIFVQDYETIAGSVVKNGTRQDILYSPVTLERWYWIHLTYDGASLIFWVDGVTVGEIAVSAPLDEYGNPD